MLLMTLFNLRSCDILFPIKRRSGISMVTFFVFLYLSEGTNDGYTNNRWNQIIFCILKNKLYMRIRIVNNNWTYQ